MTGENKAGMILTFALGAGIGAVAALLLAPQSGEERRAGIADGVTDRVDRVRDAGKHLKRRAQKIVTHAQDSVGDAIDAGKDVYSETIEAGKDAYSRATNA